MSSDILRELAACNASDPYRTKAWIPHMRGKWMTVNVPAELWERVQAAARPPECVGKDPTPPPGTEPNYCNAEHCTCRMGFGYVACDQQPKWKAARGVGVAPDQSKQPSDVDGSGS